MFIKLLFDQNLSPRLVKCLEDIYPNSEHVELVGLGKSSDLDVWQYACSNGYFIVTKDADFSEMVVLRGFPPKIIWIRIGNCTTAKIEKCLRDHQRDIEELGNDVNSGILSIF